MKLFWFGTAAMAAVIVSGCSGNGTRQTPDAAASPTGESGPAAAPAAPATASTNTAPPEGRVIPVNAQGVAPVGLTVRVKSVELGADATILDVSASYGGTMSGDVDLAFSETFIRDEQGNKLMLKRISGNKDLKIRAGDQMDGRLVFLGAVSPTAKSIELVLNDGNDGSAITGPGLNLPIPLQASGK